MNPITFHNNIKNNKHVFLYHVGGRSSSTAFQRLINSSNEVCIWGESKRLIEQFVSEINRMEDLKKNKGVRLSLQRLRRCYKKNKHDLFYPNALGNLDESIKLQKAVISNFLKPENKNMKRFGFKDIRPLKTETLEYLKKNYPRSLFVFTFRNPIDQWCSVKKLGWWGYSNNVQNFIEEYVDLSDRLLSFAKKHKLNSFVENIDLYDVEKVKKILKYLSIRKIDMSLIARVVDTIGKKNISKEDEEKIKNSTAFKNYLKMKKISKDFK